MILGGTRIEKTEEGDQKGWSHVNSLLFGMFD